MRAEGPRVRGGWLGREGGVRGEELGVRVVPRRERAEFGRGIMGIEEMVRGV